MALPFIGTPDIGGTPCGKQGVPRTPPPHWSHGIRKIWTLRAGTCFGTPYDYFGAPSEYNI